MGGPASGTVPTSSFRSRGQDAFRLAGWLSTTAFRSSQRERHAAEDQDRRDDQPGR